MEGQLKEKWNDFVSHCSMHGVQRSANRDLPFIRRLVWSLMLLASVGIVLHSLSTIIGELAGKKVSSWTEVEKDQRKEFPAVTICNMNQMKESYVEKNPKARLYLEQLYPFARRAIFNSSEQEDEARKFDLDEVNIREMLRDAAHSMNETLRWALIYPGHRDYSSNNISEIFVESFTSHGLCFTLNETWTVIDAGTNGGIVITLDVLPGEYYASLVNSVSVGAVISIHDRQEPASLLGPSITVAPRTTAKAAIRRREFIHAKLSDCREYVVPSELEYYTVYSRTACMVECKQKMMKRQCNCTSFYYNDRNSKICRWLSEYECSARIESSSACARQCPDVCVEVEYDIELSYSQYPANNILDYYWSQELPDRKSGNELSILIYYETLRTMKTTQFKAFTSQDFLSSLGGTLGLFLGSSILTIMELIELAGEWLVVCLTYRRKKKTLHGSTDRGKANISAVSKPT